ncbi:MAG: hypothetical protein ACPLPS_06275 [bacterium]
MMIKIEKLTRQQVLIAGLLAFLIFAGAMFFLLIRPRYKTLSALQKQLQDTQAIVNQRAQAEADLKKAKEEKVKEGAKLAYYEKTKMIPIDLKNRMKAMFALWTEHNKVLGKKVEDFFRNSGVILLNPVQVSPPPTDPSAIPSDIYTINLGNYSVMASFPALLNFLKNKMPKFPRVALLPGLSITGPSPVTASFSLTVYYFPKGGEAAPAAGAAPGGMMGMPPMGGGAGGPMPPMVGTMKGPMGGGAPMGGNMPAGGNMPMGSGMMGGRAR